MSRRGRVGRHPVPVGPYAERLAPLGGIAERAALRLKGAALRRWMGRRSRWSGVVAAVAAHEPAMTGLDEAGLRRAAGELGIRLRQEGFQDDPVARAFALVRAAAERTIGQRHYDVQIVGGWILLRGLVAEMETGEGKTLTATLAAATAALAGIPVHVVTVNDYLAGRDAEWMGPVYKALGLSVGAVVHGQDPTARRAAYASDVAYCTNKEIVFDYLRDRLALGQRTGRTHLLLDRLTGAAGRSGQLLLRGLHFAIVDEADSVLVDEARTPLIISGGGRRDGAVSEQSVYAAAMALADRLTAGADFAISPGDRHVRLTDAGELRLAELGAELGGVWTGRIRREELVCQALTARHLFERDQHYLVQDGKVQIIDEYTGRLMPDRSWERGLHQLIEVKEGVRLTQETIPLARISYQRFFRRYVKLAGMTGTGREVAGELASVYGLGVVPVPTNRPLVRRHLGHLIATTAAEKWDTVLERIRTLHREGRPILVGTRFVGTSETLSRRLEAAGLPHQVLNARQDQEEAEIIAEAGAPGRITVATNMAGRGTDIRLAPGVAEKGGLHVLATELHESRRIDRQLFGRCGRQGDPGCVEAIASLEDELVRMHAGRFWRWLIARTAGAGLSVPNWAGRLIVRMAQRRAERLYSRARRNLLKQDEQLEKALAFSGHGE